MKAKLFMLTSLFLLFISSFCYAYGTMNYPGEDEFVYISRYRQPTANTCQRSTCRLAENTCGSCSYSTNQDSCGALFKPSCYSCGCADINCNSNPCMSSCRYCQAFGNVGGTDFSQDYIY